MQRAIQTEKRKKKNAEGNPTKTAKRREKKKEKNNTLSPSGPPNNLLYQRFIVNQLAKAAGVCRKGGSLRDNGLPCCITI